MIPPTCCSELLLNCETLQDVKRKEQQNESLKQKQTVKQIQWNNKFLLQRDKLVRSRFWLVWLQHSNWQHNISRVGVIPLQNRSSWDLCTPQCSPISRGAPVTCPAGAVGLALLSMATPHTSLCHGQLPSAPQLLPVERQERPMGHFQISQRTQGHTLSSESVSSLPFFLGIL